MGETHTTLAIPKTKSTLRDHVRHNMMLSSARILGRGDAALGLQLNFSPSFDFCQTRVGEAGRTHGEESGEKLRKGRRGEGFDVEEVKRALFREPRDCRSSRSDKKGNVKRSGPSVWIYSPRM